MTDIQMPQANKSMTSGTVARWLLAEGDSFDQGQLLAQIETESALVDLQAAKPGTLEKILVARGQTAAPGETLATIAPAGQTSTAKPAAKPETTQPAEPAMNTKASSSGSSENVTPLLLPQAGNTMEEGTILAWKVSEGDTIEPGQVLYEMETDKATVEVEAEQTGRLAKIVATEGDIVPVKEPVAYLADNDEDVKAYLAEHGGESSQAARPEAPDAKPVQPAASDTASQPSAKESTPAAPAEGAVTPVLLPQAGNTMEEGTILAWKVSEGDTIEPGQILYEMETDKATVEVEAEQTGRLAKIVATEGDIVPVKEPVAYLADNDEDVKAYLAEHGGESSQAARPEAPDAKPVQPAASDTSSQPSAKESTPAAPAEGAVTPVLLPQAGNTMEEGTILAWKVSEGDTIEPGQVLYEMETDKATVEVEAEQTGRLAKIVATEGDIVPVKEPVAYLADNDDDVEAYLAHHAAPAESGKAEAASTDQPAEAGSFAPTRQASAPGPSAKPATTSAGRVKASPAARKIARKRGIDIAAVGAGRGPDGRILSDDVLEATLTSTEPVRRTMSKMRRAIARNLQVSKQQVPHFYMKLTVQADGLMTFYRQNKAEFPCSVNDVVTLAVSRAVGQFPAFRTRLDGEDLVEMPTANLGLAVAVDAGLVVPVLVGADRMDLRKLAGETRRIVEAARKGNLEGLGQGVLTITNLGMYGVEEFSAIINPPESGILAIGAAKEDVVVENGAIRPARTMTLTLSADHRIVDGAVAAQFMARLKELLEAPQDI